MNTNENENGNLHDYESGEFIRPATAEESRASREAAELDGGVGVIRVNDRRCWCTESNAPARPPGKVFGHIGRDPESGSWQVYCRGYFASPMGGGYWSLTYGDTPVLTWATKNQVRAYLRGE